MNLLRSSITISALLLCFSAFAEEQVISVPGEGWRIRFEAPKLTAVPSSAGSIFFGRSDRFQLSFFVEPPRCPGGDSDENIYNCFTKVLKQNPTVVWDTERGNTVPNGVQVMYIARLERDGKTGSSFNINILFARRGKWADVHGSIASPTEEDVAKLSSIMDSIKIEDERPDRNRN
jgi:hypothetical protein